jgi:hypothetical protein
MKGDVLAEIAAGLQDAKTILQAIEASESGDRPPAGAVYVAPRTALEQMLVEVWQDVLRRRIGIHDHFFQSGGDSLNGVQVIVRLRGIFGADLPLRVLFEAPTISELSVALEQREPGAPGLPAVRRRGAHRARASYAQERMWFLWQLDRANTAYHICGGVRMRGELDIGGLEWSLNRIIERHEVLRTRLQMVHGELQQFVEEDGWQIQLKPVDLTAAGPADWRCRAEEEIRRPFDLARLPAVRAALFRTAGQEWLLVVVIHHVAADGWSAGLLESELSQLYTAKIDGAAPKTPSIVVQYTDYAEWERNCLAGELLRSQLAWWREHLRGTSRGRRLATRSELETERREAGLLSTPLGVELTARLKSLAQSQRATLHMVLTAGLAATLYRYTGNEDIILGTPVAGRGRAEFEKLIGLFVNTLVTRIHVNGEGSFAELVETVKREMLSVYQRQDVPLEKVVSAVRADEPGPVDEPLVDILFSLQNAPSADLAMPGLIVDRVDLRPRDARLPLSIWATESNNHIMLDAEFRQDYFDQVAIKALFAGLERLFHAVITDPTASIIDIEIESVDRATPAITAGDREAEFHF